MQEQTGPSETRAVSQTLFAKISGGLDLAPWPVRQSLVYNFHPILKRFVGWKDVTAEALQKHLGK